MAEFGRELDASGLNCPLPNPCARKARGQTLHIIASSRGSIKAFEAYSKKSDNLRLACGNAGGKFVLTFKKIRAPAWR